MQKTLIINDLHATVGTTEILKGLTLTIPPGEIHAVMGPNGSGKSTLANCLMGHPNYTVTSGSVTYGDEDILSKRPDERAKAGLFLAFQYPHEIPGVRVQDFLRTATMAVSEKRISLADFADRMDDCLQLLKMDRSYLTRYLNEGFSGGEKKRMETMQMLMMRPSLAIMDETDSGLDIDALRIVSEGVNSLRGENFSALVITHYQRILSYLNPDKVHILYRGRIVKSGGKELAEELERKGYEMLKSDNEWAG